MKVYCTICSKPWGASKHIIKSSYVCPHCSWKMKRNIPIKLGGNRKNEKYTWGFKQSFVRSTGTSW